MSKTSSNSDGGAQKRRSGLSRRGVLKATGAGLAGAGLTSVAGSAQAAGINTPPLARDGNLLVDPQGEQVTLRGVSIADPGEQARCWRGMNSRMVVDMATAHDDWNNTMIRVPMQASFIYTGDIGAEAEPPCSGGDWDPKTPAAGDMPHGDDWGPALPGTWAESDLEDYCSAYIDDIVDLCAENGAYVQLDYHRHYPVFHHKENSDYIAEGFDDNRDGVNVDQVWECDSTTSAPHDALGTSDISEDEIYPGGRQDACGERGLLWHGEDQTEDIMQLAEEQEPWEYFDSDVGSFESSDDVYLEPASVTNALDAELTAFWEVVADRYADDDHVIFDIYNEPTGPYPGDWGAPDRPAGALSLTPETDEDQFELWSDYGREYYDLWVQRSQPWVDTAEDHGSGQVMTIGNPRWSQFVYWAPYNEHEAENMAYTSHVYLQDNCRPLEEYQGQPAEHVPVFFSEFGWMDFDLTVPTPWMTRPEVADGIEWANGTEVPPEDAHEDYEGSGMSYGEFIDQFDVHPVCWAFDHSYEPNFFEHGTPGDPDGAKDDEHWHDNGYLIEEETPGGWWRDKLEEYSQMDDFNPNDGTTRYSGDFGPNDLNGETGVGYAYDGEEPPEEGCGDNQDAESMMVDGDEVCNVNGDAYYRDVNGDGSVGNRDVGAFFERFHFNAYDQDAFDYSGNGRVSHGDVVALFNYV